nr:unnamed protein product [Callosobruchus chinensis]
MPSRCCVPGCKIITTVRKKSKVTCLYLPFQKTLKDGISG